MLSVLPAKELKIDKSFVMSMLENEKSRKLVETIINIARTMEMNVVAEGIETEEQQAVLTSLGCDYLQGFLFPVLYLPNRCRGCCCRRTQTNKLYQLVKFIRNTYLFHKKIMPDEFK
jgi:predicted signal transduction protein with EAL and GGDEF domain